MNICKSSSASIIILTLAFMFASCGGFRQTGYNIAGLSDSLKMVLPELKAPQAVIQNDDVLEIRFTGANPQTVIDFNSKGSSYSLGATGFSYLVDQNGEIEIYKLGKVKAAGFSKDQFREKLLTSIAKYLMDASISVRFANFRFTVVGEVKIPGNFVIQNEKISILEALAMSGDMLTTARRSNVRVIRDSNGVREIGAVNFSQKTLFTSPYYYLHRNDIIVVEKDSKGQSTQILSTVSSIVGIVTSIITLFFIIKK